MYKKYKYHATTTVTYHKSEVHRKCHITPHNSSNLCKRRLRLHGYYSIHPFTVDFKHFTWFAFQTDSPLNNIYLRTLIANYTVLSKAYPIIDKSNITHLWNHRNENKLVHYLTLANHRYFIIKCTPEKSSVAISQYWTVYTVQEPVYEIQEED